jgi:probable HAF family extracellular repeat protein
MQRTTLPSVLATLVAFVVTACSDTSGTSRVLPTEVSLARPTPAPPPIATVVDLGLGEGSEAVAVNDVGQIVGTRGSGAFIWENGAARSLGTIIGMTSSRGEDINESGQVVGYYYVGSTYHAFIWTAADGMQPLPGSLGGCCTLARQINDNGLVVGEATLAGGATHLVVWENGVMRDIQGSQARSVFPWGLSNTGIVVGQLDLGFEGSFSWTESTGLVHLAGLGDPNDIAIDVNSSGQIVGWAPIPGSTISTAFLWENGVITRLGTLGGASSVASGINDAGDIVGRSDVRSKGKGLAPSPRPFLWTAALGMRDLGVPSQRTGGWATGLNETGWIVGVTWGSSGGSYATLWRRP